MSTLHRRQRAATGTLAGSHRDPRSDRQANVDGTLGTLSTRFWIATVLTGIASGLAAIVMMAILRGVQHLAFSYHTGEYSTAVAAHSDLRRVLVLVAGGIVAGIGWWVLRERFGGTGGHPTEAVWSASDDLSLPRIAASGALSEVVIGMGASLGREAAPQHAAAASGSAISRALGLPSDQRLLLIACGAGAGVGAVYNVPLAGALFAAEIYLGSLRLRTVLPALITSAVATVVAWIALPVQPVYTVPALPYPKASVLVFAALAGPLLGVAAAAWVRLVGWATDRRAQGRALIVSPPVAFAILGLLSIAYPLLLGNGRDLAQYAFGGAGALGMLVALSLLKPVVTSLCLRSGASGGLFTPTLSLGAVLGGLLGHVWVHIWAGGTPGVFAVIGAAAVLAAGMRAPIAAVAFMVELTNTVGASTVAMLLAIGGAMLVARQLETRSIYSARLPRPRRPRGRRSS